MKSFMITPVIVFSMMMTACQSLPQSLPNIPNQPFLASNSLPQVISISTNNFLKPSLTKLSGKLIFIYLTGEGEARQAQLIETNIDGSQPKSLFKVNGTIMSLSSSKLDNRLIFTMQEDKKYPRVVILDRKNLQIKEVSANRTNNFSGSISPDGTQLLLSNSQTGNPEIFLTDIKGNVIQQLTRQDAIDVAPVWMSDGKSFVFTSDIGKFLQPQLYQYYLESKQIKLLTKKGKTNAIARISPVDNLMTYVSDNTQGMLMDITSKIATSINSEGLAEPASFSPDGKYLIYSAKNNIKITPIPMLVEKKFQQSNELFTVAFKDPNNRKFTIREPIWVEE